MKKATLFGLLALSAHVFADGEIVATDKMMKNQKEMMSDKQMKSPMVTLASARPESDNGWYLFADATYWHADIGSTDWAIKDNPPAQPRTFDVSSLNFKWNWGFKVGIGANIDHDMWDTNFYYTWFRTHNSQTAAIEAPGVVADILANSDDFQRGHINWNIHYSMFDWELGRWQYVSKNLALRPHVGLKGGWINQDIKQRWVSTLGNASNPTGIGKSRFENDFWGVGPCAGINTLWVLGNAGSRMQHRFSLFGDVAGALMYGHFSVKSRAIVTFTGNDVAGHRARGLSRNLASTMVQGMLGLSWDTAFNQERNHFMLKVGYEFQYWFRQNQLMVFGQQVAAGSIGSVRLSDDLALQGITAEFRFDF